MTNKLPFEERHLYSKRSPLGKKAFNGKKARKKAINPKEYNEETKNIYNKIKNIYGINLFETQHKQSIETSINYLLNTISENKNSPLAILKKNLVDDDEFAMLIAYLFGGIGDQDSSRDKFQKKLQRNYIKNINTAKYQYCFRYYFKNDYKDYYPSLTLPEFIDYLYPFAKKDNGNINSIESAIYYYYSLSSRLTAFQEKSRFIISDIYMNPFTDLTINDSLIVLFNNLYPFICSKSINELNEFIDPLLNIIHNTMNEFFNQLEIFFDRNSYLFENQNILKEFIKILDKNNENTTAKINEFISQRNKQINLSTNITSHFFASVAIFERMLVNTHLYNIYSKSKFLYKENEWEKQSYSYQELQFKTITQFKQSLENSPNDKREFINFCTSKNNTKEETFYKKIVLLNELTENYPISSTHFGNFSTPQIKLQINLDNILDLRVIYAEFINRRKDTVLFFGKDAPICEKYIQEFLRFYKEENHANQNSEFYRNDNKNFDKVIVDQYQETDTYIYTLSTLFTEKLRRGFYIEANMYKQYKSIQEFKLNLLKQFTDISHIFDIKMQFELLHNHIDCTLKAIKDLEKAYNLYNHKIIVNKIINNHKNNKE